MNRLFLSLSDEELRRFESAREELGMNRSQYLRYLLAGQKETRPDTVRYREIFQKISEAERDLKILAMRKDLPDMDRLHIYEKEKEIEDLLVQWTRSRR